MHEFKPLRFYKMRRFGSKCDRRGWHRKGRLSWFLSALNVIFILSETEKRIGILIFIKLMGLQLKQDMEALLANSVGTEEISRRVGDYEGKILTKVTINVFLSQKGTLVGNDM